MLGPNDFRVINLQKKLSPTSYEHLIGIPRLLKQEKYLQQTVELDESLLYVLPNGAKRYPNLARIVREDKAELKMVKSQINALIA